MRGATLISLIVAVVLAGAAAYLARDFLAQQQQLVSQSFVQQKPEKEEPKNLIVVAKVKLNFGDRLTPDKVAAIEWPGAIIPSGSFARVAGLIPDGTDAKARFVIDGMQPGEPVLASKITLPGQRAKMSTALEPGKKAVSIRVNDVLGVAGFVLPGDRVDIMLTRSSGSGGNSYVDVLLQGVKVLAIDQNSDDRKDKPSVVRTVTFEVGSQEAQKLVLAASVGTLSLALRNYSSSDIETIDRMKVEDLTEPGRDERLAAEQAAARARAEAARERAEAAAEAARLQREEAERRIAEMEEKRLIAEREKAELERQREAELQRATELEKLLLSMQNDVSDKFRELQMNLLEQQAQPAAAEVVEPEAAPPAPPLVPQNVKVGVIRNGNRAVYRVQHEGDAESADTNAPEETETFAIETGTGFEIETGAEPGISAGDEAGESVALENASEAPQEETDLIETFN